MTVDPVAVSLMNDASGPGWTVLARVADVVGLIAFATVVVGIASTYFSRPRLNISAISSGGEFMSAWIAYGEKGSRAALNLNVAFATIDEEGRARSGDGSIWRASALLRGEGEWIIIYDGDAMQVNRDPSANVVQLEVKRPLGAMLTVTWDNSLLPSLRSRRVILWTPDARASGRSPRVLAGREATTAVIRSNRRVED
jgi:hypothetical protein